VGGINPNPPATEDPVTTGRQFLYRYTMRNVTTASAAIIAADGAAQTVGAAGAQLVGPVFSTLNPVTRMFREVRQSGAVANANCGWYCSNTFQNGAGFFPGQNGDAGFRVRMNVGTDSQVGSINTTQLLSGITGSTLALPVSSTTLTNNAASWLGLYNLGAGGGIRFGFKPPGTGVITNLDNGVDLSSLWAAYQGWYIDIFCSPNGPMTFFTVSRLNAAGTAYSPLLVGSAAFAVYNPGRFSFNWTHVAMPTVAANNTDLFACGATQVCYPLGSFSL